MRFFVRQITTYVLLLPHVILMPRLDGEFKLFHVIVLSAKEKHTAGLLGSPFLVYSHTVAHSQQVPCNNLHMNLWKMCASVKEPLAEALSTPTF